MITDYLLNFIFGLLFYILIYLIGLFFVKDDKDHSSFKITAIGLIVVVTTYALFKTLFTSYLLIILALAVYIVVKNKYSPYRNIKSHNWKNIGIHFLKTSFPLYLISFVAFTAQFIPNINGFFTTHPDFSFYASVSETLVNTGIETYYIDAALEGNKHFVFYHYFELWLNGIVYSIFNLPSLMAMMFITIPLVGTILLSGAYDFVRTYFANKRDIIFYLLCAVTILFIFPLTSTFRWVLSLGQDFTIWNSSIFLFTSIRWMIVLSGLFYLFIDYLKNDIQNTPIILGFITLIYPTTMIVIIPSMIVWSFIVGWKKNKKVFIDIYVVIAIITAGMIFITQNFSNSIPIDNNLGLINILSNYFIIEDKNRLLLFITQPLSRSLYYIIALSPFLVLVCIRLKRKGVTVFFKKHKELLLFISIAYFSSLLGITFLDFTKDGEQLHSNLFYPLFIFAVFFAFVFLLKKKDYLSYTCVILMVFLVSTNMYGFVVGIEAKNEQSEQWYTILNSIKDHPGEIVFIGSEEYYTSFNNKNIYFTIPGDQLRFYLNAYYPKTISLDKIKLNTIGEKFQMSKSLKSGKYFKQVVSEDKEYEEILSSSDDISHLILHKKATEIKTINKDFIFVGSLDDFDYYRKLKK